MTKCIELYDSIDIDELVPLVAFLVPEMNTDVIQYYLRLTMIKFARMSKLLSRTIEIETYDCANDYYIEVDDGYVLLELNKVRLNDCCLDCAYGCECCPGEFQYQKGKLHICEEVNACDRLTVDAVVLPSIKSCSFDTEFMDIWSDAIIEGFKSFVYGGNDTRWKNITESRQALREFKRITEEARAQTMFNDVSPKVIRLTS